MRLTRPPWPNESPDWAWHVRRTPSPMDRACGCKTRTAHPCSWWSRPRSRRARQPGPVRHRWCLWDRVRRHLEAARQRCAPGACRIVRARGSPSCTARTAVTTTWHALGRGHGASTPGLDEARRCVRSRGAGHRCVAQPDSGRSPLRGVRRPAMRSGRCAHCVRVQTTDRRAPAAAASICPTSAASAKP